MSARLVSARTFAAAALVAAAGGATAPAAGWAQPAGGTWRVGDRAEIRSGGAWIPTAVLEVGDGPAGQVKVQFGTYPDGTPNLQWVSAGLLRRPGAGAQVAAPQGALAQGALAQAAPAARQASQAPAPAPAPGAQPARAGMAGGRPVGLFYMQRVWVTGGLEEQVWYFAPDGRVYQNPAGGFSPAELAAHEGPRGTFAVAGGELRVRWSDGELEAYPMQPNAGGFWWNLGNFQPVRPFRPGAALAGTYGGGVLYRAGAGNAAMATSTLELRDDGTFALGGAGSAQSTTGASQVTAVGRGAGATGAWRLAGHALTLRGPDGRVRQTLAFPLDNAETAVYPDHLYFDGVMYTRRP